MGQDRQCDARYQAETDAGGDIFPVQFEYAFKVGSTAGPVAQFVIRLGRAEVRGGGRKPWRQKGTGNARQGSIRAPHWRGGGVAHGPKPRSYAQRTPKKMKRLALASALSDRLADNRLLVVDGWGLDTPSTKAAKSALAAMGAEGRVLVVLGPDDDTVRRSLRNLPDVHLVSAGQVTTYDVLVSDYVIYSQGALPGAAAPANDAAATDGADS